MNEEEDNFNNLLSFEGEESRQESIKRKLDAVQQYFGVLTYCFMHLIVHSIFIGYYNCITTNFHKLWQTVNNVFLFYLINDSLLSVEITIYLLYAILFAVRSYLKNWTENISFIVLIIGTLIHCLGYLGPILAIVYKEYKNPFAFSIILLINLITCLVPCIVPISMLLDFYPNNEDELSIFQYLRCHCIPVIQRKLFIIFNYMFIFCFTIVSFIIVSSSSKSDDKCKSLETFYIIFIGLNLLQLIVMMLGVLIYKIQKYARLSMIVSSLVVGVGYGIFICIEYTSTLCTGNMYIYLIIYILN